MKKFPTLAFLALVTAVVAFLQFGCTPQNNTNSASTNANIATPAPTPDKAAIEAELIRIEKDWPRVLKERDVEAVRRVEADDIVEILPDGSTTTKAQDLADMQAGNLTAESWDVAETNVTVLGRDAAFVTGRSVVKGGKVKGPHGASMDISGEYRFLDTFARRDGQWKLVGSAVVKIQQPAAAPKSSPSPKASPTPKASPSAKSSPVMKASPAVPRPSPAKSASSPVRTKTP